MTRETYTKASKLMAQMSVRKGMITKLTLMANHPRNVLSKEELEKRILTEMAHLANLKKEFEEL